MDELVRFGCERTDRVCLCARWLVLVVGGWIGFSCVWMVVFGCAWVGLVLGKCVWLLVGCLKVGRFVCGWVWFWVGDFLAQGEGLEREVGMGWVCT